MQMVAIPATNTAFGLVPVCGYDVWCTLRWQS
jgi:hypothetical protein